MNERVAPTGEVTALAVRVIETYGLDASLVMGMTLELNPYGVQVLAVRLVITPAALAALGGLPHDGADVRSEP